MKNQNDLIVTVATVVLALIAITAFYFTRPEPKQPPAPEKVIVAAPQMPAGDVQFANSLPGSGTGAGGGGARTTAARPGGGGGAGRPADDGPIGVTGAGG